MKKQIKKRFQGILAELKNEVPAQKHYLLDELQRIVVETRRELATQNQRHESALDSSQLLTEIWKDIEKSSHNFSSCT